LYLSQKNKNKYWVIDIETNGLTPDIIWCVVLKNFETEEVIYFTDRENFNSWIEEDFIFIGHNAISFDIPVINKLWHSQIDLVERVVDTLVLSQNYKPSMEGGHSLDSWGSRLKYPKTEYSDWTKYSNEMLEYCINDVHLTHKLYLALSKRMLDYGYSELSCSIEHRIRIIIDCQQRNGFWFDRERADKFRQELREKQRKIEDDIHKLFPPKRVLVREGRSKFTMAGHLTSIYYKDKERYEIVEYEDGTYDAYGEEPFNLGSPKQRVERLLNLGWKPEKFTEKGFPKVDEDALISFASISKRPEVQSMSEWLVIQGRASMLDTWFNNLGEDSRIHGRVNSCGASTRRMTHNSPNTSNIPSGAKAKYGKECRSFWGVEPNKSLVLVGYDASGLETAGLCHYLNSKMATDILLRPKPDDIHSSNAKRLTEALGWECDREWAAKTGWYAWLYGAYPPKLGSIVRASQNGKDETWAGEIVIDTFFRNVPGLKQLIESVQREWTKNNGRLRTIDSGFVWCPSLNAALNYKIQSLGAILMKLAAIILDEEGKKRGIRFKLVGSIHDEGQLECEETRAYELGRLAVWSIEEAGRRLKLNVSVTGDYKIGKSWQETH
jgi:DNA polymerase-1